MATKKGWIKRKERYGKSGSKTPEETRERLSGKEAWNKGLKGYKHSGSFKKGRIVSKSICEAISKGNAGKKRTEEQKEKLRGIRNSPKTEFKKGIHYNKNTEFKKGQIPWNKKVNEKEIIKLYNSQKEVKDISKKFNCSIGVIYKVLNKHNIILRDRPLGKDNWAWKGGKSFEPYDKTFNLKFKKEIRKRDNQICTLCNIHREKLNEALTVHHINYDKFLSIKENCVSLCRKCHGKTNNNREEWINFFQSLLSKRYGYEYKNNEIILEINGGSICSA